MSKEVKIKYWRNTNSIILLLITILLLMMPIIKSGETTFYGNEIIFGSKESGFDFSLLATIFVLLPVIVGGLIYFKGKVTNYLSVSLTLISGIGLLFIKKIVRINQEFLDSLTEETQLPQEVFRKAFIDSLEYTTIGVVLIVLLIIVAVSILLNHLMKK